MRHCVQTKGGRDNSSGKNNSEWRGGHGHGHTYKPVHTGDTSGRQVVTPHDDLLYVLLNKPQGYVTTLSDPQGRPIVTTLLHGINARLFPVGRLDLDMKGL